MGAELYYTPSEKQVLFLLYTLLPSSWPRTERQLQLQHQQLTFNVLAIKLRFKFSFLSFFLCKEKYYFFPIRYQVKLSGYGSQADQSLFL